MVANNDQELRAHRLWDDIAGYLTRGNRDAKQVADVLQLIKDNPDYLAKLFPTDKSVQARLKTWEKRYRRAGIRKDFSGLNVPVKPDGFDRLLVVVREFKVSQLITELRKKFKVWTYSDSCEYLDKIKDIVQRPDGDYAVWVRDRQEADEELQNKSADDIQKEGLNTETLKERLLHEWAYHYETGKHLDINNITLCAGSRYSDGYVPRAYWHSGDGGVRVSWHGADGRSGVLRSRETVS